jgi:hypothetical protein
MSGYVGSWRALPAGRRPPEPDSLHARVLSASPPARPLLGPGLPGVAIAIAVLLAAALLGATLWLGAGAKSPSTPHAARHLPAAAGLQRLDPAAEAPISRALGAQSPAYRVRPSRDGLQANSHLQRLRIHFDASRVMISSGALRLSLKLRSAGYGTSLHSVGGVAPTAAANRVSYTRSGLSEWYVNGPSGLEQGFTVPRAPAGPSTGPLTLSMGLAANARATLSRDAESLALRRAGTSIRYRGLTATGADGHRLRSWLALDAGTLLLRVDTAGAKFPVTIDPLIERGEALRPTGEAGEGHFGVSLALSGDGSTALVGAPGDAGLAGSVWVFVRAGSTWSQQGPPLSVAEPSSEEGCVREVAECRFGSSVALSADGNTALIGAPRVNGQAGRAFVFMRSGSTWSLAQELAGGAEEKGKGRFGRSVALSAAGDTALVGSPTDQGDRGSVWVFTRTGSTFSQQGPKLAGGEEEGEGYLGRSVAMSADGNTALVGAPGDSHRLGAAWVFARAGGLWTQQGPKLQGGEESGQGRFGHSVAISADASTALIGGYSDASGVGAAWAFTYSGTAWLEQGAKLTAGDESGPSGFGYSTALSADGNLALLGGPRDNTHFGAAWAFTRSGAGWAQAEGKLAGGEEGGKGSFGASVALAANGSAALIGAPSDEANAGIAWTFSGTTVPLPAVVKITPSAGPSAGGTSVSITGSGFLSGASVKIGSAATDVNVISATEITAVTAEAPPGEDEVVVSDAYGASTGGPLFTYLGPGGTLTPPAGGGVVSSLPTGTAPAGSGVLGSVTLALPAPTLAVTGNLIPLSGTVRVRLPGSRHFVPLTSGQQVPFGTIVDATHGRVSVVTASAGGGTQAVTFYTGEFKLTQQRNGLAIATLFGGSYSSCPTARQRAHRAIASSKRSSSKHAVRKLWAEGHGHYSTKGSYATGAVLGTRWLTVDRCDGTLIRVLTDRVAVTDLVRHRRVTVGAGHSYFAKAP